MPFFMQCPNCRNKFNVRYEAVMTTCPNCLLSFAVDHLAEGFSWEGTEPAAIETGETEAEAVAEMPAAPVAQAPVLDEAKPVPRTVPAAPLPQSPATDDDEEEVAGLPRWLGPWGLATCAFAVLALLLASVVGVRILTITLCVCGLMAAGIGFWTRDQAQRKGRLSLALGATCNALLLLLALFLPGVINSRWARDFGVAASDPNKQVVVPRDQPRDQGRPLSDGEWVNPVKEAIRQDEVFTRVESVQVDRLADKGDNKYLLVYLRLANSGYGRTVPVETFSREKHRPLLTDDSGREYAFLEERPRKPLRGRGPVTFETACPPVREMPATGFLDQMLVFEAPSGKVGALNLEVPASAWGRTGSCRFRSPGLFDASADAKKGKP
jgi:hypothetical protein